MAARSRSAGVGEPVAAQSEQRAGPGDPGIVGQVGRAPKQPESRGQIPFEMELDPSQRGQHGFCVNRQIGNRSGGPVHKIRRNRGGHEPVIGVGYAQMGKVDARRNQSGIEFSGPQQALQGVLHPMPFEALPLIAGADQKLVGLTLLRKLFSGCLGRCRD
jgi:hypothetical protein